MFKECKLFKSYNFPSWSMRKDASCKMGKAKGYFIHQLNAVTSWPEYLTQVIKCSKEGTGYKVVKYKRQGFGGFKKVIPNLDLLAHIKPSKVCKTCDAHNNYTCFECESLQVRNKYPTATYTDSCQWFLK